MCRDGALSPLGAVEVGFPAMTLRSDSVDAHYCLLIGVVGRDSEGEKEKVGERE